jgi:hypothetical protein
MPEIVVGPFSTRFQLRRQLLGFFSDFWTTALAFTLAGAGTACSSVAALHFWVASQDYFFPIGGICLLARQLSALSVPCWFSSLLQHFAVTEYSGHDQSQIQTELVRWRKLLGFRVRLPKLRIGVGVFNYRKHAAIQVIE